MNKKAHLIAIHRVMGVLMTGLKLKVMTTDSEARLPQQRHSALLCILRQVSKPLCALILMSTTWDSYKDSMS